MTIEEKVQADVSKKLKEGHFKGSRRAEIENYKRERFNYYSSMDKMKNKGNLSLLDLLFQLTHGPGGVIDFLVMHPIKTIKALFQACVLGVIIYISIYLYNGGDISQLLKIFSS